VKRVVVLRAGEVSQKAVQEVAVKSPRHVVADPVGQARRLNHLGEECPLIGPCRRSLQPNREASLLPLKEESRRAKLDHSNLLHHHQSFFHQQVLQSRLKTIFILVKMRIGSCRFLLRMKSNSCRSLKMSHLPHHPHSLSDRGSPETRNLMA